jgi:hypothetical protein
MKRAMCGKALPGMLAATIAACSPEAPTPAAARPDTVTPTGWTRPPAVLAARKAPGGLIFTGEAEPGGRVVLRSETGAAYAVVADRQGRFEIRMAAPTAPLFLRPETQVGQDAVPAPERLLILAGGEGPIAVLRPGGPTRRLDAAPALGAVDSDGQMRLASGQARGPVTVQANGTALTVTPDRSGRWSVMLRPSTAAERIVVGAVSFDWPGEAPAGGAQAVARAGAGWRVSWTGAGGARQTTWLPDHR